MAVELCARSARLSAALRERRVQVFGVDYDRNPQAPSAPIIKADLSDAAGQAIVKKLLNEAQV